MSPEQRQINELKKEVTELKKTIQSFGMPSQIKPEFVKSITAILSSGSTKSAASATQSVNEGGAATYSVMTAPDGFIRVGGYNVPYIN